MNEWIDHLSLDPCSWVIGLFTLWYGQRQIHAFKKRLGIPIGLGKVISLSYLSLGNTKVSYTRSGMWEFHLVIKHDLAHAKTVAVTGAGVISIVEDGIRLVEGHEFSYSKPKLSEAGSCIRWSRWPCLQQLCFGLCTRRITPSN